MQTTQTIPATTEPHLLCPLCAEPVAPLTATAADTCPACNNSIDNTDGIWRCLSPSQLHHYQAFIADYEFIRAAEGRGSHTPGYYRALPDRDLSGRLAHQWRIRARTFAYLTRYLLNPLAERTGRALRILDLGAGNGWLSHRLTLLGHFPVAVDLLTNPTDGLAAAIHYPHPFPRIQAALDTLPLASGTFDLAIFNASFHYATDYTRTLAEALRCLRPGGSILIADTPWYPTEASGAAMVAEKHRNFQTNYKRPSDSIPAQEFLTPNRLRTLESTLPITFQTHKPFYGLRWAMRPVVAQLRRRRIPSEFHIFHALQTGTRP